MDEPRLADLMRAVHESQAKLTRELRSNPELVAQQVNSWEFERLPGAAGLESDIRRELISIHAAIAHGLPLPDREAPTAWLTLKLGLLQAHRGISR
ncbi:MAG: hypothetical protein C1943_03810 [Halochromatium sp.]|nr:hypothetical protein [Halochromatium sp.]